MLEYVKCNLCGNDFYDIVYPSTLKESDILHPDHLACTNLGHSYYHRIVKCKKCGLIYCNPRDDSEFLKDCYKKMKDESYCMISTARVKTFKRVLSHLEKYKKGKRLLDVGCNIGLFMDLARLKGWEVVGVESSQWASDLARERNKHTILNCSIFDIDKINDKFDVITMWDVLEHFSNPHLALEICHGKLLKDGIIAISTMRCEGLFYTLCRSYWPWFMRMHIYYFTKETLLDMLEKTGFRIIGIYPYVHYINLNYLLYKMKLFRNKFSICLKNPILNRITLPIQLGDFMEIYAAKR